ncbi:MAG: hypothetical protein J6Y88_03350, partial [Bacteroidales bacterium]|nr:hypothetical protein [Bacteroidales bacterium]
IDLLTAAVQAIVIPDYAEVLGNIQQALTNINYNLSNNGPIAFQLASLGNQLAEIAQSLANAPDYSDALDALAQALADIQGAIEDIDFATLLADIKDAIDGGFEDLGTAIENAFDALAAALPDYSEVLGDIKTALTNINYNVSSNGPLATQLASIAESLGEDGVLGDIAAALGEDGIAGVLEDILDQLGELTTQDYSEYFESIVDALEGLDALSDIASALDDMQTTLTNLNYNLSSNGAIATAFNEIADAFGVSNDLLEELLDALTEEEGNGIADALAAIADALADDEGNSVADALNEIAELLKEILAALNGEKPIPEPDEPEPYIPDIIVDWYPVNIYIEAYDSDGQSIISPDMPGMSLTFQGTTYTVTEDPFATRAINAVMWGLIAREFTDGEEPVYKLVFGEINGALDMDEDLVLQWPDGTSDVIHYHCSDHVITPEITCTRTWKLNGEDHDGNTFVFTNKRIPDSFEHPSGHINGSNYVDMGNGLKWATVNIDATKPGEGGSYYAWGETVKKNTYTWATYKYMEEGFSDAFHITKYQVADGITEGLWYQLDAFNGDGKTTLEPEDDAATQNWGGTWRMPTLEEWSALQNPDNFDWEWTTREEPQEPIIEPGMPPLYSVLVTFGWKVTSKMEGYEGNNIFFPAAGCKGYTSDWQPDLIRAYYWSSSLYAYKGNDPTFDYDAAPIDLDHGTPVGRVGLYSAERMESASKAIAPPPTAYVRYQLRHVGMPVRAVSE